MKRFLLISMSVFSLTSCQEPERNCAKFRTGTFQFESYLEGELVKSQFVRSESIEIDSFRGKTDTSSVRWINNCEYIISNLNPKNRAEEKPIHIKILTTQGNSYTFEYGLVGESKRQRGTVTKVK